MNSLPSDRVVPVPNVSPITPSQRLPFIHHALRQAQVMYVELRYEGRGGTGGYVVQFHDRHRQDGLWHPVDPDIKRQLVGFLWHLVQGRYLHIQAVSPSRWSQ